MGREPNSGGMRIGLEHPLEKHLLQIFELDEPRLFRLSRFLLAHAALDRYLIILVTLVRIKKAGGVSAIGQAGSMKVLEKAAEGTFGRHVNAAENEAKLPEWARKTASCVNKTRNAFLHWKPTQSSASTVPKYRGRDVTTNLGLLACLSDVHKVIKHIGPPSAGLL